MNSVRMITQAYSQTPWRKQLQGIGLFLSVLILGLLVAIIYLNVSARSATIGREIQYMQAEIQVLEQDITTKQSKLAAISSAANLKVRAVDMGFAPVAAEQNLYVAVPGYPGKNEVILAPPPQAIVVTAPALSPEYTISLIDWLKQQVALPGVTGKRP